jgi:hypothetical protein
MTNDNLNWANATVNYTDSGLTVASCNGGITTTNNSTSGWTWYYPYYGSCYPVYEKSKVEQAFKIVSKLMEKKIIKSMTLKKFIDTVNAVSEIL